MSMITLRAAGVPEHFNLAWRRVAARRALEPLALDLRWQEVPEGTGRMLDLLEAGEADLALMLTEGAVAGVANGRAIRLLCAWVSSPLRWGVHVAAEGPIESRDDLPGKRFAISRFGSGSHLMAGIYARDHFWSEAPEFVVVNNLEGAREALAAGEAEAFLWERFTTQPVVDAGDFRRIDELPTPWPCFVAAVPADIDQPRLAAARLAARAALHEAGRIARTAGAAELFAAEYGLNVDAAAEWLAGTRWADKGTLDTRMLSAVGRAMRDVGMIKTAPRPSELLVDAVID